MKQGIFLGILIGVFLILIYSPAFSTFLIGDDFDWLDSAYCGWQHPLRLLQPIGGFFRPLIKVTYLVDYSLFGPHAFFYNVTNLLFHIINVSLLCMLLFRVTGRIFSTAIAALGFAASAFHSEATLWAAGRPDSVLAIFLLLTLLLLSCRWERFRVLQHVSITLLGLCAACSKESWVLLPVIAITYLWLIKGRPMTEAVLSALPLILLLSIYLFYFIGVPILTTGSFSPPYGAVGFNSIINKFGYLMFKYVGAGEFFVGSAWQLIIVSIILISIVYRLLMTKNFLALWGAIWMLSFVWVSLPIYYAASRYNYIPLIGFWVMLTAGLEYELGCLANRFQLRKRFVYGIAISLFGFYVAHQSIMVRWDIQDYRRYGELHRIVYNMYLSVKSRLPIEQPVIFVNSGTRRAVTEARVFFYGYRKLFFSREDAIWQEVSIDALANFAGEPFIRLLRPVPGCSIVTTLRTSSTILVFDDSGFSISHSAELQQYVADYYCKNGCLPPKVEVLRFVSAQD